MLEEQEGTGVWYLVGESVGQEHILLRHKQITWGTYKQYLHLQYS